MNAKETHDIVLIHVARTWERIRLKQKHQEMPEDNIESASCGIPEVTYEVFKDKVIQEFIDYQRDDWDWNKKTKGYASFSDEYIENRAYEIIYKNYLL